MPTRTTSWPAGAACWVDNHVPDLATARAFYGAVFGWQIDDPDLDAGNFAAARRDGWPVAGFLVAVEGARPVWHVYFATDDIEATARAIDQHGGSGLFGPHPVPPDRGTFQLAADPGGATFGVWQANALSGVTVYAEHGALAWAELHSTQPGAAQVFYPDVFGVRLEPIDDARTEHVLFRVPGLDDVPHARVGSPAGAGQDSEWSVCFVVDDIDAACAAAVANGGRVTVAATNTRHGRTSSLVDPFGAAFIVANSS